jgi:hypothetical protein
LEDIVKKLISIVMLLAVVACKKESTADFGHPAASTTNVAAPGAQRASQDALAARSDGAPAALVAGEQPAAPRMPPMIVRTADVRIIVADTSKTVDAVTKAVEAQGGYVSGSNIWREGELLRAKLTLRVPGDRLTSALAVIRGLAKRVDNETITSEDVSQEYVDLESQVRNLEATEVELRELLKTARVNSKRATDVLEVHQQLTVVRGQIEQAKGRMRYLAQVTSLSSIALDVVPDAIAQPVVEPGWQPLVQARNASRSLIALLQRLGTATIWFVIYFVPILGMLALLISALVKMARRSRPREA